MVVLAEPPVSSNYLPPQQQPSAQYGPPRNTYSAPPVNNYIPPQEQVKSQYEIDKNKKSNLNTFHTLIQSRPQPAYGVPSANQGYPGGNNGGYGGGGSGYGGTGGGYESNEPARYNFEYNVQDYQSGNDFGHMESRDGDKTTGRYYVLLPDGRKQIVNYEADRNGYRPTITYEQTNNINGGGGGGGGYNSNAQSNNNQFNGY